MEIVTGKIQGYLFELNQRGDFEDPILRSMEELGDRLGFPIVGPLVGGLLFQLARIGKARTVFELGSGFGYSTYWFAKALPEDGQVHHTDADAENSEQAKKFLRLGKLDHKVIFHTGEALESLKETGGTYDIIFCDVDKEQYPDVYPLVKKHLARGGLFMVDNMLWFGRVIKDDGTPETRGVKKLTELLFSDKDFFTTLMPLRDGVSISYRLK